MNGLFYSVTTSDKNGNYSDFYSDRTKAFAQFFYCVSREIEKSGTSFELSELDSAAKMLCSWSNGARVIMSLASSAE